MKVKPWAWVVISEPSPFRRSEQFVYGPIVGLWRSKRWARRYLNNHPFGMCDIVPADSTITDGTKYYEPTL